MMQNTEWDGKSIPKHVPKDKSWCLDTEVARLAMERRTK
jgi:hypothetical protein